MTMNCTFIGHRPSDRKKDADRLRAILGRTSDRPRRNEIARRLHRTQGLVVNQRMCRVTDERCLDSPDTRDFSQNVKAECDAMGGEIWRNGDLISPPASIVGAQ